MQAQRAARSPSSYSDRDGVIWLDGELVPWRGATVHVLTHGLHYASAVFEGERVYAGKVFKLREHTERLLRSAVLLDLDLPFTCAEIEQATQELVRASSFTEGYVRPVAWRGSEGMGIPGDGTRAHLAIAAWQWPAFFSPEARKAGIRLRLSRWRRPAPETAPTQAKAAGLYMISTLSQREAQRAGFDDALLLGYHGYVAEASGANFFMVLGDTLHTPIPDCFLDGITRATVIEIAREMGIEVVERHIKLDELGKADEVFLTGTSYEIQPVRSIDSLEVPGGGVTEALTQAFIKKVYAS